MNLVKGIKLNGCFYFQGSLYIRKGAILVCEIDSMKRKTELRRVDIEFFDNKKEIYPLLEEIEKEEKNFYMLEHNSSDKSITLRLTDKEADIMGEIADRLGLYFNNLTEYEDVIEFD